MDKKLYKGWKIIKMVSEGDIKDGTKINQYIDGQLDEFIYYIVKEYNILANEGFEITGSILVDDGFEFEVIYE